MRTTSGLLLVDKPSGLTSHDVVARVRRLLDERRVGHAGTLDPMATGLLVMAAGPSTRLLRFAQSEVKRYSGAVRLGEATDSLDADGIVTVRATVPVLSSEDMKAAAGAMIGAQQQIPPMVSALKVGGKRLHELARQGIDVVREPRGITIHEFVVMPSADVSVWNFEIECSVGTYVRVVLSDLAQRVGTVGHLIALRRLSSGSHRVDDALTLEQLGDALDRDESPLRPSSSFVTHLEHVVLEVEQERRVRRGQRIELDFPLAEGEIAAMDQGNELIGILSRRGLTWQPDLVLPPLGESDHG